MRGRKPEYESRAAEFRQRLIEWKQIPESMRPSLRALARELGTSHQLLKHYLDRLEKWQYQERCRKAKQQSEEIRARAAAEGRYMTAWEEQQVRAYDRAAMSAMVAPMLLDQIERIKQADKQGPLNCYQIKTLKLLARGFPEARELLQKYSQVV
jgi:hypothetical protein